MDSRPLTKFEEWAFGTSHRMLAEAREAQEAGKPIDLARLELKVSIMLVQARALECRKIYGDLMTEHHLNIKSIIDKLTDRSSAYEKIGLAMAKVAAGPIVQTTVDGKSASGLGEQVLDPDVKPGGTIQ